MPARVNPVGLAVMGWDPIVTTTAAGETGVEGGRGIVWVPMSTFEVPREMRVPDTVTIPPGVRVVPATTYPPAPAVYAPAVRAAFLSVGEAGRSRVLVPTMSCDCAREILVPEIVTAGPPSEIVVPAIEKMAGFRLGDGGSWGRRFGDGVVL